MAASSSSVGWLAVVVDSPSGLRSSTVVVLPGPGLWLASSRGVEYAAIVPVARGPGTFLRDIRADAAPDERAGPRRPFKELHESYVEERETAASAAIAWSDVPLAPCV